MTPLARPALPSSATSEVVKEVSPGWIWLAQAFDQAMRTREAAIGARSSRIGSPQTAQPTMSASVKNWAISILALSGLSEPCTEFPVKLSA
jgi:hypothetical protein